MQNSSSEWWRWELNRKIAEFLSSPSAEQEAELRFLLTSYRALQQQPGQDLYAIDRPLQFQANLP